ncbi:MAG: DUF6249 domain-containing protein [Bacteroidota bacterium]
MEKFLTEQADKLIVLVGFITAFFVAGMIIARYFKYKHLERLALIEKGLDLPSSESNLVKRISLMGVLKLGIICCGAGLGVLIGFILQNTIHAFEPPLPYLFAIPFCSGVSLIVYYLVSRD